MKPKLLCHSITTVMVLILSACNPAAGGSAATSTATPIPSTPTVTPTPAPPSILIGAKTDCFSGPGAGYRLIASFESGDEVEVVGKDDYGEYWIVIDPKSGRGCWIRREGTTAQGVTDYLPNLLPPPTPLPDPPAAPANLTARYDCTPTKNAPQPRPSLSMADLTIYVSWEDEANNESSYRVYVNGAMQALLDQNATTYKQTISIREDQTGTVLVGVEAYDPVLGPSERIEMPISYSCK